MTVEVPLTQGYVALIDDADAERVLARKWWVSMQKGGPKAMGHFGGKQDYLHRFIVDAPAGTEVDHADGDTLNNRRSNLRIATRSQNCANSGRKRADRGVKGVDFFVPTGKWRARVTKNGVTKHLGYFDTREQAARTYDEAARAIHGQFALTNRWLDGQEGGEGNERSDAGVEGLEVGASA